MMYFLTLGIIFYQCSSLHSKTNSIEYLPTLRALCTKQLGLLFLGSTLREGKDAYIPVAFGQNVDVYLISI